VPAAIGQLTGMQRLSLHINELVTLPPEIGKLTQMEAV
jgi:Leucine-rich repeat (LRR) protein